MLTNILKDKNPNQNKKSKYETHICQQKEKPEKGPEMAEALK